MRKIAFISLLLFNFINLPASHAQYGSFDTAKMVKPFKLFDNLYYVGIDQVSAYLLVTDKGLILIDALYGKYADHIPEACRELGFDPKQIKYILCTHGHFDHCEGAERIKQLTHARIGMTAPDWDEAEWKTKAPYTSVTTKMTRDWVIKDGDVLTLGRTTLHFYQTPGHTPGVLSIAFPVRDQGKTYNAFMFGGVGLNFDGVERTEMYLHSVDRIMAMKGIQVNITNHPGPGTIFEKAKLLVARKTGEPNPYVAPEEFQAWLVELKKAAEDKLLEEKKKKG
jgi:metallo-beta-lactamase class B